MASWLWLTSLLSLALFIYIGLSGRETSARHLGSAALGAYGISFLLSITSLAQMAQEPRQTYLLSFFGMPVHFGFIASIASTTVLLVLYGVLILVILYLLATVKRTDERREFADYSPWLFLSWFAFAASVLIISPTFSQAAVAVWCGVLVTGIQVFITATRQTLSMERRVVSLVMMMVSAILQTLPTWVAWSLWHTVQVNIVERAVADGSAPTSSPDWLIWIWGLSVVLQTLSLLIAMPKRQSTVHSLGTFMSAASLFVLSGLYVWCVWTVVVLTPWMTVLVGIAGCVALYPIVTLLRGVSYPSSLRPKEDAK